MLPAYREVWEQAGFLEYDTERAAVGRNKKPSCFVLPDPAADGAIALRGALQTRQGAQNSRLTGT